MISLEQVETRLGKDFQVGSEDWIDEAFTRQIIRWTQDSQNGPFMEINQNKAIDEREEIPVERNTKENLHCTPSMLTKHRSLLGQTRLAAEQDTIPMLPQNFQMRFDGIFLQQIGETDQVTTSEASVRATHWIIENTWIS